MAGRYYVPTSTGDDPISDTITTQKHACVVDRARMLKGEPATEQCIVIDNVNFLNNADVDGRAPAGRRPERDDGGGRHAAEKDPRGQRRQRLAVPRRLEGSGTHNDGGPIAIAVAPYRYLCGGQLTNCVPQPGSAQRLDAQGDKIMARLVYRKIGDRESLVAVHSVDSSAGGGGVRWYEFRIGKGRKVTLYQQGTYAPDSRYRWMASPAMDRAGNIGIGYSFGGSDTVRRTALRGTPRGRSAGPVDAARDGPGRG